MAVAGTKGQPFSVRLSETTDAFVRAEARRTRRSKSAVVEALTEEASRMRRFPGIGFRGDDAARRAWVIGTGLDVWEVIQMAQEYPSAAALSEHTQLTDRDIRLAQAYHQHHPDEIDEAVAENRRPLDELVELYPFLEVIRPDPDDGGDAAPGSV